MGESLIEKLKQSATEFSNAKHTATYSIVKLQPGFLLLGPSRSANRSLIAVEFALFVLSMMIFVLQKAAFGAILLFLFALFLDWTRRKMSRDWFQIDGQHITGHWTRVANAPMVEIDYVESQLAIDIHTWSENDSETGKPRSCGAVRIRTSNPEAPDVYIAESQVHGFRLAPNAETTLNRLRECLQPRE